VGCLLFLPFFQLRGYEFLGSIVSGSVRFLACAHTLDGSSVQFSGIPQ